MEDYYAKKQECYKEDKIMAYIVMRADYSSTLSDKNGPMIFETRRAAEKTAKNFSGRVVNLESRLTMEDPDTKVIHMQTVGQNMGIENAKTEKKS